MRRGKTQKQSRSLQRAFAIYKQALGSEHSMTQIAQANYTALLRKMGFQ